MLKSCSYCGGIHDVKYQCPKKPNKEKKLTYIDKFRWTKEWQNKRKFIREDRDRHMCQICIRELHNTQRKYNFNDIQVHHIIPIASDWEKRLDDTNLISLCPYHHSLAENKFISKEELIGIVQEQEDSLNL